ncbi:proline-rich protein 36-like [Toxotes jaculatrix]|uniref:proline-rich protein 36-like n=1 Tax=Toxotes jaculatrix TaxID=941984 RepID=UPI001B3A9DCF|nr:proline-rich protein 36-like [Toxotes jaculatrix]
MPWKNPVLYFFVTATLTSLKCCGGQAAETADVAQRPPVQGRLHFKSVVSDVQHESAVPTRYGSLAFESDKEGDHKSTPVLHRLMDAKLNRLDPSVQCSDNSMTLKVKWLRAPHLLVNSGVGPLTPLSQMPSSCGFSVKRSRRDVLFAAPYQGCHVIQQGGDYVLPLRLWGAPMTMSCPAVLPPPSVSCFPSGMVVKIGSITANELKVKESGVWKTLSSVCGSCGLAVEVFSRGLVLTAPYNRGLCIEIKDEQYLLSLLLADVELLVTCPSLPNIKPTTAATTPPSDHGQVLQYHQFPQFPMFPQYPVLPEPTPPTHTPAPVTGTVAPLPQQPQFPSAPAAEPAQHPSFPFMPQYPQFPQYVLLPRPVPPVQSTTNKNTAAPPAQSPQLPPPQQPQFPVLPQYHFLPFPKLPLPPEGQPQAVQNPKPVIQQPKPQHVHPHTYQIPVLYPPPKYPSQRLNTQAPTAAPVTTSTTSAATAEKPFYYPHPHMPVYYPPQQAPMPVFPDSPTTPLRNTAPFDQHQRQPIYHAVPPFYPFPSHQWPKSVARSW